MKTNYERNRVLNNRYGDGAGYVKPATVYIAAFTAMPTVAGGGTEPVGGAYARVAVTNDATNFPDPVDGVTSNALPINYAQATALWGTVVGGGAYDAPVGGNLQDFAPLQTPRTVNNGDTFGFAVGQLRFEET